MRNLLLREVAGNKYIKRKINRLWKDPARQTPAGGKTAPRVLFFELCSDYCIKKQYSEKAMTANPLPGYAELHCLSNFTFLRGASHPEELVLTAAKLGYAAIALTDECSFAGVVRAHEAAKQCDLRLIIGTELRLAEGPKLLLLATDRGAYACLSALITKGRRKADKGSYHLTRADLDHDFGGCLALLIPEKNGKRDQNPFAFSSVAGSGERRSKKIFDPSFFVGELAERFPKRAWIAYERHLEADDTAVLRALRRLSRNTGVPLVATGDVHMHARARQPLQDTLTAIRLGCPVTEAGFNLYPNAERRLRSRAQLARLYPPGLLAESLAVAERCRFSLDELRYEYPREIVPSRHICVS